MRLIKNPVAWVVVICVLAAGLLIAAAALSETPPPSPTPPIAQVQADDAPPPPVPREDPAPEPAPAPTQELPPPPPPAVPTGAFAGLPVNETRPVDFSMDEGTRDRLTPRELSDQLRDWLLFTLVGQAGLPADAQNRATFDLPTLRHGYLRTLGHFEYGTTRSCLLGDGRVVALLPEARDRERRDHLGRIADEARKTLGGMPAEVIVFEYAIDPTQMLGWLTRRETLRGQTLFTAEYGYYEEEIRDGQALAAFLRRAPNLTLVRDTGKRLVLGGRRTLAGPYRGFRAEDVAAVWQAQRELEKRLRAGERVVGHTGFSLDPAYDYDGLAHWFDRRAVPLIEKVPAKARDLDRPKALADVRQGLKERQEAPLLEFIHDLKSAGLKRARGDTPGPIRFTGPEPKGDEALLDLMLAQFDRHGGKAIVKLAEILNREKEQFAFQAARYDGALQGTEVGMVLFYTDLLAKLWQGVGYSPPRDAVPDFRSQTDGGIPAAYRQQVLEQPSTRIWFGPEERGYQLAERRRAVLLAPRAVRIFAASSNPLRPDQEAEPTYASEHTIGWWDDHYEEVARYEPEYERLNEYIKWSLVLAWLSSDGNTQRLGYLDGVDVDRSAWFPDWAAKNPRLRYRQWDRIGFHPRGHRNAKTETLPILHSEPFANFGDSDHVWTVSGGVSGARPTDVKARPTLPEELPPGADLSLRGVDPKAVRADGLATLRGTEHRFEPEGPDVSRMKILPRKGTPLQGPHGELAPAAFERVVTRNGDAVHIETRAGQTSMGELRIRRAGNGFSAGHLAREIDAGISLARDLSRAAQPPERVLGVDARVETFLVLPDDVLIVKLHGQMKWVKLTPERKPSATVVERPDARISDSSANARTLTAAWIESARLLQEVGPERYLRFGLDPRPDQRPGIDVRARGPPEGATPLEIESGGRRLAALVSPDRSAVWINTRDIPPGDGKAVEELVRLSRDGPEPLRAFLKENAGKPGLRYAPPAGSDRELRNTLVGVDALLSQDRPVEALHLLRTAEWSGDPQPEVLARRGLAELLRNRPGEAAAVLNKLLGKWTEPAGGLPRLIEEINARLGRSGVPPPVRENLLRVGRHLAVRDLKTKGKTTAEVELLESDGVLSSQAILDGSQIGPATADDFSATDRATLYLVEGVTIENLDPSPAVQRRAVRETVRGGKTELFELYDPAVSRHRQDRILFRTETPNIPKVAERLLKDSAGKPRIIRARIAVRVPVPQTLRIKLFDLPSVAPGPGGGRPSSPDDYGEIEAEKAPAAPGDPGEVKPRAFLLAPVTMNP